MFVTERLCAHLGGCFVPASQASDSKQPSPNVINSAAIWLYSHQGRAAEEKHENTFRLLVVSAIYNLCIYPSLGGQTTGEFELDAFFTVCSSERVNTQRRRIINVESLDC